MFTFLQKGGSFHSSVGAANGFVWITASQQMQDLCNVNLTCYGYDVSGEFNR